MSVEQSIKPERLQAGDIITLVAPSSAYAAEHPDSLARAVVAIQALGYRVNAPPSILRKREYSAGTAQERADALMAAFADPITRAIWCVSGGTTSNAILDKLDYTLIARNPKILIGLSDITALLNAIYARTGLVTFLGPLVIHNLSMTGGPLAYTRDNFMRVVTHCTGQLALPAAQEWGDGDDPVGHMRQGTTWWRLRGGRGRGRLIGGNLVTLLHLLGTPYAPDFTDKLLIIEDTWNETPDRIERYLTHLRLAGVFGQIAGLIIGRMEAQWAGTNTVLARIVTDVIGDYDFPIVAGVDTGHTHPTLTLPLGIEATLDADALTLTLDEAAVQETLFTPSALP